MKPQFKYQVLHEAERRKLQTNLHVVSKAAVFKVTLVSHCCVFWQILCQQWLRWEVTWDTDRLHFWCLAELWMHSGESYPVTSSCWERRPWEPVLLSLSCCTGAPISDAARSLVASPGSEGHALQQQQQPPVVALGPHRAPCRSPWLRHPTGARGRGRGCCNGCPAQGQPRCGTIVVVAPAPRAPTRRGCCLKALLHWGRSHWAGLVSLQPPRSRDILLSICSALH